MTDLFVVHHDIDRRIYARVARRPVRTPLLLTLLVATIGLGATAAARTLGVVVPDPVDVSELLLWGVP